MINWLAPAVFFSSVGSLLCWATNPTVNDYLFASVFVILGFTIHKLGLWQGRRYDSL